MRTQPGIILDELNDQIEDTGLMFAPDPSTSNRGNVGGALGNNSCGAHSIVWGKTVDNTFGLSVVLANGDTATLGGSSGESLDASAVSPVSKGTSSGVSMQSGSPTVMRSLRDTPRFSDASPGYNLDELLDSNALDMARFVVGSEGTLVTITEATLKLVPRPRFKSLAVIHFNELIESMEATVAACNWALPRWSTSAA